MHGGADSSPMADRVVRDVGEDTRAWRRRAVVSGVWHCLQRESGALAVSAKLCPNKSALPGQGTHRGCAPENGEGRSQAIVYVSGNGNLSGEDMKRMMSTCGRVTRVHTTDAYSFVEVRRPTPQPSTLAPNSAHRTPFVAVCNRPLHLRLISFSFVLCICA
jgi:hypothetical protein